MSEKLDSVVENQDGLETHVKISNFHKLNALRVFASPRNTVSAQTGELPEGGSEAETKRIDSDNVASCASEDKVETHESEDEVEATFSVIDIEDEFEAFKKSAFSFHLINVAIFNENLLEATDENQIIAISVPKQFLDSTRIAAREFCSRQAFIRNNESVGGGDKKRIRVCTKNKKVFDRAFTYFDTVSLDIDTQYKFIALLQLKKNETVVLVFDESEDVEKINGFIDKQVRFPVISPSMMAEVVSRSFNPQILAEECDPSDIKIWEGIDLSLLDISVVDSLFIFSSSKEDFVSKILLHLSQAKKRKNASTSLPKKALSNFFGMEKIKEWSSDLKSYFEGIKASPSEEKFPLWKNIPSKLLLSGKPGSGKTSIAAAIAYDCGLHFVPTSYSALQSAKDGNLGDLVKAMKNTFNEARKNAPSLLFIDELDSFGNRDGDMSRYRDWNVKVINALLEELDGVNDNAGIVIIGATNYPERIDAAIKRSGRLGFHLEIEELSAEALTEIYKDMLINSEPLLATNNEITLVNKEIIKSRKEWALSKFGKMSVTMTGADVEHISGLINDTEKTRYKQYVEAGKIDAYLPLQESEAMEEIGKFCKGNSIDERMRAAYFVAGQAVMAKVNGVLFDCSLSCLNTSHNNGIVVKSKNSLTANTLKTIAKVLLGGAMAEEVFCGNKSASQMSSHALKLATNLLKDEQGAYGFHASNPQYKKGNSIHIAKNGSLEKSDDDMYWQYDRNNTINHIMFSINVKLKAEIAEHVEKIEIIAQKIFENYSITANEFDEIWNLDIKSPSKQGSFDEIMVRVEAEDALELSAFNSIGRDVEIVKALLKAKPSHSKPTHILIYGAPGSGKTSLIKAIAKNIELKLYQMVPSPLSQDGDLPDIQLTLANALILKNRDLKPVQDEECAAIIVDKANKFLKSGKEQEAFTSKPTAVPTIWLADSIDDIDKRALLSMSHSICLNDILSKNDKKEIVTRYAESNMVSLNDTQAEALSAISLPPAAIKKAMETACIAGGQYDTAIHVFETMHTTYNRGESSRKEASQKHAFDTSCANVIINENNDLSLDEFTDNIVNSGETSISIIMHGPSGTGKSAYAKYLAEKMGLDFTLVAASSILGRYVGETERNIANMFARAEKERQMIIIDEADSFFRNRETAQQSWQVSQVNEMLLKMESFPYPFVCTTNLNDTIDPAATSRFLFKIEYDFIKPHQINKLCRQYFGEDLTMDGFYVDQVAPRDIVNAAKRARIMGVKDKVGLAKMIEAEQKSKKLKINMGFIRH